MLTCGGSRRRQLPGCRNDGAGFSCVRDRHSGGRIAPRCGAMEKRLNEYELLYIVHPRKAADETASVIDWVDGLVQQGGGEVLTVDDWGRRRLAYPITHEFEGNYVLTTLRLPPASTGAIESRLVVSEDIMRHILIRGIIPFDSSRQRPQELERPAPVPSPEQPAAEQPAEEQPAAEPAAEQPAAEQPAAEQPAAEEQPGGASGRAASGRASGRAASGRAAGGRAASGRASGRAASGRAASGRAAGGRAAGGRAASGRASGRAASGRAAGGRAAGGRAGSDRAGAVGDADQRRRG